MLPRLDAVTVTPVKSADGVGAGVAIGDGRQAAFQRAVQSLVGQTVPAEVLSKLKDGSYLVKVADNAVRLMLPGDTQVGSSVPLTVLTAQPRPTFQLGTSTPGGAPTLLYTDAGVAEGGEAATLPSQGTVVLPGSGKPASGAAQGAPGQPGAPATGAGAGADAAADADGVPGQVKPGLPGTPASGTGTTAGNPAANAGNTAASGRPGLPAGAAPDTPDAPAGNAAQTGRPAVAAGNAAVPNPATTLATLATPAGAAQAQAQTAATLAAGTPGAAIPADAVKPQSLAATLLGKAPLTPANELPELSANTPQATLSSAARVLTTILSTSQAGQAAQAALIGKTALFGNAAPDTDALAQKLHETISKSGLFYESHVAEWVKGERPLAELMREPQMQRLLQQQGGETAARAAAGGPDLSAAQMINQQLHTQEQNRVLWHGQAWPGQEMQWDVRRDQREGGQGGSGDADGEPEQIWRSGVRFRLPMLGAVSAAVTLVGEQVHIQVQTDNDGSAVTLRAYASQLESAMAAAGAQLTSLTISQESDHD
jgi:hypothetical protein